MKKRIILVIVVSVVLSVSFVVCRFFAYELHGNKQWAMFLFAIGFLIMFITTIKDYRKVMIGNVVGYVSGFVLGSIFNTSGVVQDGSATDNWWAIWTVSYISIIIVSVIIEIISKHKEAI